MKTKHIGRRKAATPGVADDPIPATVPAPQRAPTPAADQEPPLCPVCEIRNAVDGQRCQQCIDQGGDGEDPGRTGVARPGDSAEMPRRRSPSCQTHRPSLGPELQPSGDADHSLDAELVKLGLFNRHGDFLKPTKGKLLKGAKLIVQELQSGHMPTRVQHIAGQLAKLLDGFKNLRTR